ncbi:hypothetical protein BJV78DRAFT_864307 [Lactifluus subvellereus]|nr:hypothetical protein BJV78DRAFT_864307 [Lactifluus subvellereus]
MPPTMNVSTLRVWARSRNSGAECLGLGRDTSPLPTYPQPRLSEIDSIIGTTGIWRRPRHQVVASAPSIKLELQSHHQLATRKRLHDSNGHLALILAESVGCRSPIINTEPVEAASPIRGDASVRASPQYSLVGRSECAFFFFLGKKPRN